MFAHVRLLLENNIDKQKLPADIYNMIKSWDETYISYQKNPSNIVGQLLDGISTMIAGKVRTIIDDNNGNLDEFTKSRDYLEINENPLEQIAEVEKELGEFVVGNYIILPDMRTGEIISTEKALVQFTDGSFDTYINYVVDETGDKGNILLSEAKKFASASKHNPKVEESSSLGFEIYKSVEVISPKGNKVQLQLYHYPENKKIKYRLYINGSPDLPFYEVFDAGFAFDALVQEYTMIKGYSVVGEKSEPSADQAKEKAKARARARIRTLKLKSQNTDDDSSGLPNDTQTEVNAGRVTYRGMGFGKEGNKIKVHGKEYIISNEKFNELGGVKKIKFNAPFRKG